MHDYIVEKESNSRLQPPVVFHSCPMRDCHSAVCFQSRRSKFGPRRVHSSQGGILQESRAISPPAQRSGGRARSDPLESESPLRTREFDILAKRRCVVGDLTETGCAEGTMEAKRSRFVVNRLGESITLVTRRALETCPQPRFTMRSFSYVMRLPVLDYRYLADKVKKMEYELTFSPHWSDKLRKEVYRV